MRNLKNALVLSAVVLVSLFISRQTFGEKQKTTLKPGKCFLWKVQSGQATVYLYGTLHFGKQKFYPLDPTIEKAFDESDYLVLEVNLDMTKMIKMQQIVMKKGFYPDNDSVKNHVSPSTYEKVSKYVSTTKIPMSKLQKMRPWNLSINLSMLAFMKAGCNPMMGVEKYLTLKAQQQKKPILDLETVEQHINLLADMSPKEQENMLNSTIDEIDSLPEVMKKIIPAWQNGQSEVIYDLFKETKMPEMMKKIFDDRNIKMTEAIEKFLKSDKTYFVAVGGGHYAGPKGIIALLKKKNFKVVQLEKRGKE